MGDSTLRGGASPLKADVSAASRLHVRLDVDVTTDTVSPSTVPVITAPAALSWMAITAAAAAAGSVTVALAADVFWSRAPRASAACIACRPAFASFRPSDATSPKPAVSIAAMPRYPALDRPPRPDVASCDAALAATDPDPRSTAIFAASSASMEAASRGSAARPAAAARASRDDPCRRAAVTSSKSAVAFGICDGTSTSCSVAVAVPPMRSSTETTRRPEV